MVTATKVEGRTGGVALVHRQSEGWGLESTRSFGANVIKTTLVCGRQRKVLIGAYIPPSEEDGSTLDCIQQARDSVRNPNWPVILLGDLNVDLDNPAGNNPAGAERRLETAALVDSLGVQPVIKWFKQSRKRRYRGWTFRQVREGRLIGSVTDHVLSSCMKSFLNCQLKIPRFDTDHTMLVATLSLCSVKHHRRYVRCRSKYPLQSPSGDARNEADVLLEDLLKAKERKEKTDGRKASWVSDATWKLVSQKASARKRGDRRALRSLKVLVRRSFRKDRRNRAKVAALEAQQYLAGGEIRKAFGAIKGWYRDAGPRPAKPSREDINATRREYIKLYTPQDPVGDPIPIHAEPVVINDDAPTEDEVVEAVHKLSTNKAAGATGLKAEDLKEWLKKARPTDPEQEPDPDSVELWEKVLEIVRLAFVEGVMPKQFAEGIFVLIPKSDAGEYRGIALLEIMYKVVSSIVNSRLLAAVKFDDSLHGNRPKRGTGTAIMEAKLLAQVRCRIDEPLFMVFVDLKKAYYSLDRERAMLILEGYGVGANICRIISMMWQGDTLVPRQAGYYGKAFKAKRGVRVGDVMSPTVFNIVVDAVVRHWKHLHNPVEFEELALFYADDGMITGTDQARVQASLDAITSSFATVGLKMNSRKTKFMVMAGGRHRLHMRSAAYRRKQTGEGATYRERMAEKVQCLRCGALVRRSYLKRHQTSGRCITASKTYQPPTPVREQVANEQAITQTVEPNSYQVSIPRGHPGEVDCPVEGCPFRVRANERSKRGNLRTHFRLRHVRDTICVEEEGQLPRCTKCGIFMRDANSEKHYASVDCRKFALVREKEVRAERQVSALQVTFTVGGEEIERVKQFRYLGRILDEDDDDSFAAGRQLARARAKWRRFGMVLRSEGVNPRAMGYFYKAVVQAVLLYGSETWILTEGLKRQFQSFHSRVARFLTGKHIRPREDGSWHCPPTAGVLEEAGLETVEEYILRRRQTVRGFVRHRPMYQHCMLSAATGVTARRTVWWRLPV